MAARNTRAWFSLSQCATMRSWVTQRPGSAAGAGLAAVRGQQLRRLSYIPAPHSSLEPHVDITVPDIGHFVDVLVIEVHVTAGDVVAAEDPLITLESDKATLDVPAPVAGTACDVATQVGDRVSAGTSSWSSTPRRCLAAPPPRR